LRAVFFFVVFFFADFLRLANLITSSVVIELARFQRNRAAIFEAPHSVRHGQPAETSARAPYLASRILVTQRTCQREK